MFACQEDARQVDLERSLPDGELDPVHARVARVLDAGIRDDHVEAAIALDGGRHSPLNLLLAHHVAGEGEHRLANVRGHSREPGLVRVEAGHPRALGREADGRGPADPGGGPRHERALPLEAGGSLRALREARRAASARSSRG